jgi:hypothetical protein
MIIDLLRSNGSIVVNKNLVFAIGVNEAILYSELISKHEYFANKDQLTEDGYFFNTVDNLKLDTGIGEKPQKKAIKTLEALGLIKTDHRGLPRKRYFKIIDNEERIKNLLMIGKHNREEVQNAASAKNEQNKARYPSNDASTAHREELVPPNGSVNNTKANNPKKELKDIYIISQNDEYVFSYYSKIFKQEFNKDHPTMNKEKMQELLNNYYALTSDLDIEEDKWVELVNYHFENLSPKNDGNILSFLSLNGGSGCIYRYLQETEDY